MSLKSKKNRPGMNIYILFQRSYAIDHGGSFSIEKADFTGECNVAVS